MDIEALLAHIEAAIASITHPAFYADERAFQGELLVMLRKAIPDHVLSQEAVIQQEYQKRLAVHRLKIRPDIIIHEPFNPERHAGRDDGNFLVIELKRRASPAEAKGDFDSLLQMMNALAYPAGVFINVASERTHAEFVPHAAKGRITCFAVWHDAEGKTRLRRDLD